MPTSVPKVSVIIPAYNAEKYLHETIKSVLEQTANSWELIIVNDGSTDKTEEVARLFADQNDRISLISKVNAGVSMARNVGIEHSKGQYLAFLDADDIWLSNNLAVKVDFIDSHPTVGLVHSSGLIIDENSKSLDRLKSGKSGKLLDDLLLWEDECVPTPSSILTKRSVINELGGFDVNLSNNADQEFFIRVASKYEIGKINKVTWKYRIHANNMHNNIRLLEKDSLYVYDKVRKLNLFRSKAFENRCTSNMYSILAFSWMGDAKNYKKGLIYLLKALARNPLIIWNWIKKLGRRF